MRGRVILSALLALLALAFILPVVACGGGDDEGPSVLPDGPSETTGHVYSFSELKLIGFKEKENITDSFSFPGLQGAWKGNIMFIKMSPTRTFHGDTVSLEAMLFDSEISEALKAEIQSAGLESNIVTKFEGDNLVLRCTDQTIEGAKEGASVADTVQPGERVCSYFLERLRIEYRGQKPRQ